MGHGTIYLVPIRKLPLGLRVVLYQSLSGIEVIQIWLLTIHLPINEFD